MIECWYTPSLPLTVIGPGEFVKQHPDRLTGHTIYSNEETRRGYLKFHGRCPKDNIVIDTIYRHKKSYTGVLSLPINPASTVPPSKAVSFHETVAALTEEAKGILWHQRLNHENRRKVSDAHKYVDGIPSLKHPYDCQGCPVCFETKPKRTSTSNGKITQDAHSVGTGLSADWGFVVQKSKNKTRLRQLEGEHGEQAFLIVADHFSGMLYGMAAGSKAPPLL